MNGELFYYLGKDFKSERIHAMQYPNRPKQTNTFVYFHNHRQELETCENVIQEFSILLEFCNTGSTILVNF